MKYVYEIDNNSFQGDGKKVLAVCSSGMLRSPTIAYVLSGEPWNYNTRTAATYEIALDPVTEELLKWADEIVCADIEHVNTIRNKLIDYKLYKPIVNLKIPYDYEGMDPILIEMIISNYNIYGPNQKHKEE